jgi:uncharacterized protein (DUF4415 family)
MAGQELEFEWDESKAKLNLEKHGASFLTAAAIFSHERLERIDDREDYGWCAGSLSAGSKRRCIVSSTRGAKKTSSASSAPKGRANMKKKHTMARHSLSEIDAMRARGLDRTRANAPRAESLGEDFWKSACVAMPPGKTSVHLRLDSDVVEWFKSHGKGHLTRMNAVLRAYVEAQKRIA